MSVAEVIKRFGALATSKTNNSEEEFGTMGVDAAAVSVEKVTLLSQ